MPLWDCGLPGTRIKLDMRGKHTPSVAQQKSECFKTNWRFDVRRDKFLWYQSRHSATVGSFCHVHRMGKQAGKAEGRLKGFILRHDGTRKGCHEHSTRDLY